MSTLQPSLRQRPGEADAASPWTAGLSLWIPPADPASTSRIEQSPAGETARPRFRVLIADDDASIVEITSLILHFSGYDVAIAEDGEQAWRAYLERGCDLLLTDQDMPRLSGLELIERIRSHGDPVPVVLTSGRLAAGEIPASLRDQINAVLPKPFATDILLETIRGFVRRENRCTTPTLPANEA